MRPPAEAALERLALFGIRPGLDGTRALLRALGAPQGRLSCVLVAGTNGKGTTSALLASMASAAGYSVGLFTSPHLAAVEERIRIDGACVDGEELGSEVLEIVDVAERVLGHPTTYFETLTAAAFRLFAAHAVDLAVIEVGLGGRLDATNVCEPVLSLISSVGLDHQRHLGETLAEIAREKAGILRAGRPALAHLRGEARAVVEATAAATGTSVSFVDDLVERFEVKREDLRGQQVFVETSRARYEVELHLPGHHQVENLALALLGAEHLAGRGWDRLDLLARCRGASRCHWWGRLERVELPDGGEVVLDGAHNGAAASALAEVLARHAGTFDLLFGVLDDKRVEEILPPLAGVARRVILVAPSGARGRSPEDYRALWRDLPSCRIAETPAQGLDALLEGSQRGVVAGSLHLAGEIREGLRGRFGRPEPSIAPLW